MLDTDSPTSKTQRASRWCGLLAGGIGAVSLAGWIFDIPTLQRLHPALVTMKANTAIALLLAAASLLLQQDEKVTGLKRRLAQGFAAVIILLGVLTLGEHLSGVDFGIDQFLFRESVASAGASFPGRMGVASTVVFMSLGCALMFLDIRIAGRYWASRCAVVAAVATTLVFLYYFYGIDHGEAISKYVTIALHTVVAFYALCVGVFYARPHRGVMVELLGSGMGSVVARRLLPAAFFVPILLGWLKTLAQSAGLFGQGFGTATFVLLIILLFAGLIRWTVISINRQETERKRAEVALRRSEANLRDFVDHATVGLHWVGPDGVILWANQAELNLLGYTSEEYIGHSITEFHADEEVITDILSRLVKGESLHEREARLRCKDGTIRHVLINSNVRFEDGRFVHTRCFTRDITESRKAEAAQARLAAIVTSCNDGILSKALDGTITTWNPGAEKIFGYTAEEMVGQPVVRLFPPERAGEEAEILAKLKAGVQIDHYETERVTKDGRKLPVSLTLSLIHGPDGTIVGASKIVRDITDRKRAENELRESKERAEAASRAKDDFLAALSHELRTPLTPVLMMAAALGEDPALPAAVREQLAMMRRNVELEARLIDDLLDLTRINRGKLVIAPVTADVHQLLSYTAEIVLSDRLGKDVSIVFKNEAVRHHALADPTRLQQVFWNLIKNAIKFTPPGGSITVLTHNDDAGRIILSVADTGVGISAEALPHIFKAFEQGDAAGQHRYGGLGLGLAISQAIMEAHGGSIGVSSAGTGQGAVFTVGLASVDAPADSAQDGAALSGTARALRLLIVEDHVTTRTVLSQLLTRSGHEITTAENSQEALDVYAAGTFDGVISDLGLPDGSGLELMREIQKLRPVPAIALSGYGMEDDLRLTKEAGFFAHLVKPVNLDQLRHLIDQIAPAR